jgi:hypothetical protein
MLSICRFSVGGGTSEPEPGLAVLDASRRSIALVTEEGVQHLHASTNPIAVAATSTAARHIAYVDETGQLVVLSSDTGGELVRARLTTGH